MAHCINCETLISDRPEHSDFCSQECEEEYSAGADKERLHVYSVNSLVNTGEASNQVVNPIDQKDKITKD